MIEWIKIFTYYLRYTNSLYPFLNCSEDKLKEDQSLSMIRFYVVVILIMGFDIFKHDMQGFLHVFEFSSVDSGVSGPIKPYWDYASAGLSLQPLGQAIGSMDLVQSKRNSDCVASMFFAILGHQKRVSPCILLGLRLSIFLGKEKAERVMNLSSSRSFNDGTCYEKWSIHTSDKESPLSHLREAQLCKLSMYHTLRPNFGPIITKIFQFKFFIKYYLLVWFYLFLYLLKILIMNFLDFKLIKNMRYFPNFDIKFFMNVLWHFWACHNLWTLRLDVFWLLK